MNTDIILITVLIIGSTIISFLIIGMINIRQRYHQTRLENKLHNLELMVKFTIVVLDTFKEINKKRKN